MELRLLEAVPWPLDFAISLKGDEGMELKREKFDVTQCENFMIFLPLRFYVKSILVILEVQICHFNTFRDSEL